jgi:hypothetical protein
MIIDTQNVLAMRVLAFPTLAGSSCLFNKFSFDERLTNQSSRRIMSSYKKP